MINKHHWKLADNDCTETRSLGRKSSCTVDEVINIKIEKSSLKDFSPKENVSLVEKKNEVKSV